jgi:hypothetical protein
MEWMQGSPWSRLRGHLMKECRAKIFPPFPPFDMFFSLQLKSGGLCKGSYMYFSYSLATSHMYGHHLIIILSLITNHYTNPLKAPFQPSLRP